MRPRAPDHHAGGRFRNPWIAGASSGGRDFLRWQRERRGVRLPPDPAPEALPAAEPHIAGPRAPADEVRITWVGHATFLLQVGGLNILSDPQWSRRASPVQFAGPTRFVPPGVPWERLPPIDAVLQSHDHYDHLDSGTVRALHRRFGDAMRWYAPLAYRAWFVDRGVGNLTELDWWQEAPLPGPEGTLRIVSVPSQHWTSRTPFDRYRRLWASWCVITPSGRRIFFCGDSGYFPGFVEIGARLGPFDAVLLPIGAYEPRWFMAPMHMDPEEAVRAYLDLGGQGTMIASHWGTWRLTDEDPLEPPERARDAWTARGLPPARLWIPRHGETRVIDRAAGLRLLATPRR